MNSNNKISKTYDDALIDLFKIGGLYRKSLYSLLQQLRVCKIIEGYILELIESDDFSAIFPMKVPVIHCGIRVDIPGENEYLSPPHQDIYSCHCANALRVWIPLRDVNSEKGTMKIYAGSHKEGIIEPDFMENPNFPSIEPHLYNNYIKNIITLEKGNAVFFHPLLIHGSVPPKNKWNKIKFISGGDIQDLTTLLNKEGSEESLLLSHKISQERKKNRDITSGY